MKTTISFSIENEEKVYIKKFCKTNNMNLSQFIRNIVIGRIAYLELKKEKK
jgi:hypothetical protein